MDIIIHPRKLNGSIPAIPSKSQAHRLLICAAFSKQATEIICPEIGDDIQATVNCLVSLGAKVKRTWQGYQVTPITQFPTKATIPCGESGTTLRFLLPIVAALGIDATFLMDGRLPYRPLSPLWEEMERMGCTLSRPNTNSVHCTGKLRSGTYNIAGNISSQFISGLLFAGTLINGSTKINIEQTLESAPYVNMTLNALHTFGVQAQSNYVSYSYPYTSPGRIRVEGDWSNAAFFLGANSLGSNVTVQNLNVNSLQGDSSVHMHFSDLKEFSRISLSNIPDIFPILAVVAAGNNGAEFTNIARLRLKESDRIQSVTKMLDAFGVPFQIHSNGLTVYSAPFRGCEIDSCGDHRIAMAATIASTVADGPIKISGAECVRKSYPRFWDDFKLLGGYYEQYLR